MSRRKLVSFHDFCRQKEAHLPWCAPLLSSLLSLICRSPVLLFLFVRKPCIRTGRCLPEQRDRAEYEQSGHDKICNLCISGKKQPEYRTEQRPAQGKYKADQRKEKRKKEKQWPLSLTVRQDIGLHGHNAVNIDLRIYKLQKCTGEKAAFGMRFLDNRRTLQCPEGKPQHIKSADYQHGQFDPGDDFRKPSLPALDMDMILLGPGVTAVTTAARYPERISAPGAQRPALFAFHELL